MTALSGPGASHFSRRDWLAATGAIALSGSAAVSAEEKPQPREPFGYCFNTSTIRGQKLDVPAQIDVISDAGFSAAELWIGDLEAYLKSGGSLRDLAKRIRDRGLALPSAISFPAWISDDASKRKQALEQVKREMEWVRELGGTHIAAPPAGAGEMKSLSLNDAAERYRSLLDVGKQQGVIPQLELWGFSKYLSRLSEVAYVAIESGHPDACLLLDVYHLYKGGSQVESLRLIDGAAMHVMHVNDYPANPPRAEINDAARVFPGDGVAPLKAILQTLRAIGYRGYLSLEVFNRDYWKQDPHLVARTGLAKMKAAVKSAFAT